MDSEKLKISKEIMKKRKLNEDNKEKVSEKKNKLSFLDNLMEHPSSGLRLSLHGNIYQLKLLMLFMIRGRKQNLRYRLATEFDPAEKFDDLFFEYENENGDGSIIRVLQAKHKQDDNKTISLNDLLTETDGEFSLRKYFISYCKIRKHAEFTRENTEIRDFIICTNIDLHMDLKENFEQVGDLDEILDTKLLKFKDGFAIKSKIESIFKNTSESCRLAKKIASLNKLDLTDELLRTYHGVLAKYVFNVIEEAKVCYSTFRDSFIDLSDNNKRIELALLRNNVFSYLKKKGKFDLVELKNKKIPTSRNFGKIFELNDIPEIKDSDQLVKEFANLIKNAQNNIVQVSRTNKSIKDNINELAGYLLIKKEDSENDIYFLSSAFFDDNCLLPAELTIFRSNLKAAFKKEGIAVNKDEFKFKITKFHTCYDGEHNTKVKEFLPDDCVTDEEIKGFLNKLVFAVNQPNEVTLGKIIATEILADVNVNNDFILGKFESYMLNWMKKKEGSFLTFEDGKKLFEEAKCELDKLMFIGLTFDYLAKMDEFCLTFTQNAINNLQMRFHDFLNAESNYQILNILSEHTELCSIKIYQIIKEFADYTTKDSYIFLCLSTLLRVEDQLLRALGSHTTKLLIIANDNAKNDIDNENLLKLIKNLKPILNKNSYMKIIIIDSSEKASWNDIEFNIDEYEDRNLNLTDLTLESLTEIISNGIVSFQGHHINLDKLLNCKLYNAIDGNILSNLIHKQELKIGAELSNLGEIEHYYIMRTLKYCVNIDLAFKKKTEQFFIINGKSRKQEIFLNTTNFEHAGFNCAEPNDQQDIILISDSSDGYFKELCNKYRRKNIHWLKQNEEKVTWKHSYGGNLSKLRKFMDKNTPEFTKPKIVTDIREKLVVIVAEPGMGKSTLITYLALQTKKSQPSLLILKINLIDNSKQFQSWRKKKALRETDINDFLYSCYLEKTNEGPIKTLEKTIFDYCYQEGKMIVMFDGFDEISPDYKTVVIKILKVLQKTTIGGLWITTRPYNILSDIENALNTFSYSLQPISKENQISFLKSYWAQNLKVDEIDNAFIKQLLGWFSEITNDKNDDFVTVPLQLRMIAEVFHSKLIDDNHELSKNYSHIFEEELNLLILYEKFIDIKFDKILMQGKNDLIQNKDNPCIKAMINDKRIKFLENHKKLALLSLFGTDGLKLLNIEIGDSVVNIKEGKEKAGIIDRVIEEKPIFVHKSYADYFAALWFDDNWKKSIVKSFLMEYIFKEENNGIRRFFDYLLAYENIIEEFEEESECNSEYADSDNSNDEAGNKYGFEEICKPLMKNKYALHTSVLNNDEKKLKQLLEQPNSYEIVNRIDKGGRTALHLMASYNYYNIFDLFMSEELMFDNDKKDKLFGWSPIIYAEKSGSWNNVESLLKVDANKDESFKNLDINGIYEGPNYSLTERNIPLLHIATCEGLLNFTKVLIKRGSDVTNPDRLGRSSLHYAASHDGEIVEVLIKHLKEINPDKLWEYINMKDKDNYNALHIAAQLGKTKVIEHLFKLLETKFPENLLEFINARVKFGFTALHILAQENKPEVAEVLLKLVETKFPENLLEIIGTETTKGSTALNIAAQIGSTELVKVLLKLVETKFPKKLLEFINTKATDGFTALFLAAQEGKTDVVEVLLKLVENKFPANLLEFINTKMAEGYTALHVAAVKGTIDVIELILKLVESNFPENLLEFINTKTTVGKSVLHVAAKEGNTKVVELFLKLVENKFPANLLEFINTKMVNGLTALHLAALTGKTDVVELILKLVESNFPENLLEFINTKDTYGWTTLHIAVHQGKTEVVELLIKSLEKLKPDKLSELINAKNHNECTALHITLMNKNPDIIKILIKYNACVVARSNHDTILHKAVSMNNEEILQLILNKIKMTKPIMDPFINASDTEGDTPLMWAAQHGRLEMGKSLLEYGANLDKQNYDGETALHWAVKGGYYETVKLLLNKNANSNINDKNGKTPIKLAVELWNKDPKNENFNLITKLLSQ